MTIAERPRTLDRNTQIPEGAIFSNDKRIIRNIEEYFEIRYDRKHSSELARYARTTSYKFATFFHVLHNFKCIGIYKKGNSPESNIFFKRKGIAAIINSKSMKELEMNKGTVERLTPEITDTEFSAMQYALRQLNSER